MFLECSQIWIIHIGLNLYRANQATCVGCFITTLVSPLLKHNLILMLHHIPIDPLGCCIICEPHKYLLADPTYVWLNTFLELNFIGHRTPQVYYEGDTIKNLDTELARAAKLKCSSCGVKGAALGCYVTSCRRSYHVPCAFEIQDCRWDMVSKYN